MKNRKSIRDKADYTRSFLKAKKLRGCALFSISLYMFIFAVIILGGGELFFIVQKTWREKATVHLQNQLVGAVSKVYGTNGRYGTGNMIGPLNGAGVLPDYPPVDGTGNTASMVLFAGPITITGATTKYSIAFENLDTDTCEILASKTSDSSKSRSDILALKIDDQPVVFPLMPDDIEEKCSAGTSGELTVTWEYGESE